MNSAARNQPIPVTDAVNSDTTFKGPYFLKFDKGLRLACRPVDTAWSALIEDVAPPTSALHTLKKDLTVQYTVQNFRRGQHSDKVAVVDIWPSGFTSQISTPTRNKGNMCRDEEKGHGLETNKKLRENLPGRAME